MPDFTSLLKKPAGEAKKPPALDVGLYPGMIAGYELGDANKNKTPYVRFNLKLTGWPDGADPQTREDGEPIDLSTKSFRRDMYLTDDALWRLDQLLRDFGLTMEGRSYEDVLPETISMLVLVDVRQYMTNTNDIGNQVEGLQALK